MNPKSFEEAKNEWLAKIGNKSWEDLYNDFEAESNAKLLPPEYLAMWAKSKRDFEDAQKAILEDEENPDSKKDKS